MGVATTKRMPPTTAQYATEQLSIHNITAYDKKAVPIDPTGQYAIWSVEGKPFEIRLALDVVDRLNPEVMRGFGAVRRRGTETGGILLGSIEPVGDRILITVDEFETVPCEYAFGPSYVLSPADLQRFRAALATFDPSARKQHYTVGYFRSHTRDGLQLDEQDTRFFRNYFPDPYHVAMLVKPFATRAPQAGFFFQEKGVLPLDASYLEFPFRRRDLVVAEGGEEPDEPRRKPVAVEGFPSAKIPAREPRTEAEVEAGQSKPAVDRSLNPFAGTPLAVPTAAPPPDAETVRATGRESATTLKASRSVSLSGYSADEPAPRPWKARLGWIALSTMLVVLGMVIGSQYSSLLSPSGAVASVNAYAINLRAEPSDSNLLVKWDSGSAAIKGAQRGVLTVQEGQERVTVELNGDQLRTGSVLYRHLAPYISFKLEVYLNDNRTFAESFLFQGSQTR
jgi:hypothetical protein